MGATIIDGKALAAEFRARTAQRAGELRDAGTPAKLDAVLVESGDNAARVYAQNQAKTCAAIGIDYELHVLEEGSSSESIAEKIRSLNADPAVHAIMVHMPLPDEVDAYSIKRLIDADKDAESVNPANIGNVVYGRSMRAPCTALAALRLIDSTGIDLKGKHCVVVGASATVGRPTAVLLMQREATVISCNKYTREMRDLCLDADVLVAAAGVPGLITRDMVRPGALVVDVGVNRVRDLSSGMSRTVGDVAFDEVREIAGWITPVPGGVGPMTVAVLLHNVVELAQSSADARPSGSLR
jgi:methylenetetrahydrofolate dehydrogenase (NADP+)/methenyltetrahydrofolate cyclohydrolase